MTAQASVEQKATIFKTGRKKGEERWFVRVTCNFLEPRIYGPFPAEQDALRFREGAEFELRKLLDCQLASMSGDFRLQLPPKG